MAITHNLQVAFPAQIATSITKLRYNTFAPTQRVTNTAVKNQGQQTCVLSVQQYIHAHLGE